MGAGVALALHDDDRATGTVLPSVTELETAFARATAAPHAVAFDSSTTALHQALTVAGVGPGDDVVVPAWCSPAVAQAPACLGAHVVLADVDPATGTLSAQTVAAVLTSRTRAVLAVDHAGVPVDVLALREVCDSLGVVIVEEASTAAGSTYVGAPVGVQADVAVWALDPASADAGGVLTTCHGLWALRARRLRDPATSLTHPQAVAGLAALDRLTDDVRRRRDVVAACVDALGPLPDLRVVADPAWGTSSHAACWVEVGPAHPLGRDGVLARLAAAGISGVRPGAPSVRRPVGAAEADLPAAPRLQGARRLAASTLVLPLRPDTTYDEVTALVDALRATCR